MKAFNNFDDPKSYSQFRQLKLRPGARTGLWCAFLLPVSLVLSCTHPHSGPASVGLWMSALCLLTTSLYLVARLCSPWVPAIIHSVTLVLVGTFLHWGCNVKFLEGFGLVVVTFLAGYCGPSFVLSLVQRFPFSFSIGEAAFIYLGLVAFVCSTVANCIVYNAQLVPFSHILVQVPLLGLVLCLMIVGVSPILQRLVSFALLLFVVLATSLVVAAKVLVLERNPIVWFITDFVFASRTRVVVIVYWVACSGLAVFFTWHYGNGGTRQNVKTKLTVLRKFFHLVVVAVYLPGILWDVELLFVASIVAVAAFLFVEVVRLYDIGGLGVVLNDSLARFLDEKDQGTIILTHTYLLVGCSLPVWFLPATTAHDPEEFLLMCSGIVSLGVGDAAASVGGTIWGKTKFPGGAKSVEGTLCSIVAELVFIVPFLGLYRAGGFPWGCFGRYAMAATGTSIVEAFTTQIDNLVLPLVMYIILLL